MTGVRYRIVSEAELRRAWSDETMTVAEAAASVGITRAALLDRAHSRGFPSRKSGRRFGVPVAEFTKLWNAGVRPTDLQARYHTPCRTTLTETAKRLGLRRFRKGESRITLDAYQQIQLTKAMADAARITRAAFKEQMAA